MQEMSYTVPTEVSRSGNWASPNPGIAAHWLHLAGDTPVLPLKAPVSRAITGWADPILSPIVVTMCDPDDRKSPVPVPISHIPYSKIYLATEQTLRF